MIRDSRQTPKRQTSARQALTAKYQRDQNVQYRKSIADRKQFKSGNNPVSDALRSDALDLGAPDNYRGRKVVRAMARRLARRLAKLPPDQALNLIESRVDPEYRGIVIAALESERTTLNDYAADRVTLWPVTESLAKLNGWLTSRRHEIESRVKLKAWVYRGVRRVKW